MTISCGIYSFTGSSIPIGVETFQVNYFENSAGGKPGSTIEPGLDRDFTIALQDLIVNQTSLNLVNEGGDIIYSGEITEYSVTPMAATAEIKAAQNRLTMAVMVSYENALNEEDNIEKCNSPYAVSKLCNESYAKMYNQLYGINTIGLRFFTVYGPRGRPDMAPYKFIKRILNNDSIDKYGTGETMRDYTYISDIVSGIMGAINLQNKNENKIYNLGNNSPISLNNFIKLCEEVCDKKALITQKDNQLGDVPVTYADIILASKELNYSPKVLLKDGLLNLKKWLEKNV